MNPAELYRQRAEKEGRTYWIQEGTLGVFDVDRMHGVDTQNFQGAHAPSGFKGLFSKQSDDQKPTLWSDIRALIAKDLLRYNQPQSLIMLYREMLRLASSQQNKEMDLGWFVASIATKSFIPLLIKDSRGYEKFIIIAEQDRRLARLIKSQSGRNTARLRLQSEVMEVILGLTLRSLLARRARQGRRAEADLIDAVRAKQQDLGVGATTYIVSVVLTAIAGAPGPVAACLMAEFCNRPDWQRRIKQELSAISLHDLAEGPVHRAPQSHAFVQEVMRLWGFPPVARRFARKTINVGEHTLAEGDSYILSTYVPHRDQRIWEDPERFDPHRWLRPGGVSCPHAYVPFGWGNRTCLGAPLGVSQLLLLLHLFVNEVALVPVVPEAPITVDSIAFPRDFRGVLSMRSRSDSLSKIAQ